MIRILALLCICLLPSLLEAQPAFVENKGQWNKKALYKIDLPDGAMFLEEKALTYTFFNPDDLKRSHAHHNFKQRNTKNDGMVNYHSYKINFINSKTESISSYKPHSDYLNFFTGNDPSKWHSRVQKYSEVKYSNIYSNIDLHLYSNEDFWLKYDFIVYPGGNAEDIRMKYEGHTRIEGYDNGGLRIITTLNELHEIKPVAWQEIDGQKVLVECKFLVRDPYVAFLFPMGYNPNYKLIIDPILVFSTYSGSTTDNWGFTATFDNKSNVYSGGIVRGSGYPVNIGAYQQSLGGEWDIGIIKYTSDGITRLYATYLGGVYCEMPHSLVVNSEDELIIFGTTGSHDFPTTPGAYRTNFVGGTQITYDNVLNFPNGADIFITKMSSDGTSLNASTFIGGSKNDGMNFRTYYSHVIMHGNDSLYYNYADGARGEVICGRNDDIFVGTTTFSDDFPVTAGAFQTVFNGKQEGIVFKMSPDLSTLIWSSFFGGSNDDAIYSLDVDIDDDVYIAGGTNSVNILTTGGVYQPLSQGGSADGFVAHISSNGSTLIKSTYFGSPYYDQVYFVRVNRDKEVYITGQTKAPGNTFIHNAAYATPNSGQFIAKFPNNLSSPIWSTVFGTGSGKPNISITAFAVDYCNRIYLAGWGREWAFHDGFTWASIEGTKGMDVTPGSHQTITDGQDFYLMVLKDDASALEYATFMGEQYYPSCSYSGHDHVDGGTSRFDKFGNIYQSICASCGGCNAFPTYPNPGVWSPDNGAAPNNNCNNAVFKFNFAMPMTIADFNFQHVCLGEPISFNNNSTLAENYFWNFGDGNTSTDENPTHSYTAPGVYTVSLLAENTQSCNFSDSITKQVIVEELYISTNDISLCEGDDALLTVNSSSNNAAFIWSSNNNFTDTLNNDLSSPNHTITPSSSHTFYINVKTDYCSVVDSVRVEVSKILISTSPDTILCQGNDIQIHAYNQIPGETLTYSWSGSGIVSGNNSSSPVVAPIQSSVFIVTAENQDGCITTDSVIVDISPFEYKLDSLKHLRCYNICEGSIYISAIGESPINYTWNNGQSGANLNNLCKGFYTVSIIDAIGCSGEITVTINEPPQLNASIQSPQGASCSETNPNTGIAVVTPWGGSPGYTYQWNNLATDSLITDLFAGLYIVTVTDANNCDTVLNVTVQDESQLQITALYNNPSCHNYCDGNAQASIIVAGVPPYNYSWSTGSNNQSVYNLCPGNYFLTVIDADYCSRFHSVSIGNPPPLHSQINTSGIICYGETASLTANVVSGGNPPYSYVWSTGASSESISNATEGDYWVIITDNKGCKDTVEYWLPEPPELMVDTSYKNVICAGVCNGRIELSPSGGTFPYSYNWNGTLGYSQKTNLCPGNYYITVSDANGCTKTLMVEVGVSDYAPPLEATADDYYIYPGQTTNLHANTGNSGWSYYWSPSSSLSGAIMQHPTAKPLETTTYTVTVTDNFGCTNVDTVTIRILDLICGEPYIYVPNAFTPNNDGFNDVLYVYAGGLVTDFYFAIYDRWGEAVFISTNPQNGWDGTYRGRMLDPAVFVYYLKVTCLDQAVFEKKGNITLVR